MLLYYFEYNHSIIINLIVLDFYLFIKFSDDTEILSTDKNQFRASNTLQIHLDDIAEWARRCKTKSVHILFTFNHKFFSKLYLKNIEIPTK